MHVTTFGVALFLHIGVVILAFMIAAVLHASLHALVRADNVAQMRPFAALVHRLEPLLPILALLIIVFGAWLIHLTHGGIGWGDGWILTALVALVVIEGLSGALLAPASKKMQAAVEAAPDGPVPAEVRQAAMNPMIWDLAHIASVAFLGVVFIMAAKPSGGLSVAIVIIGAIVGVALSRWQLAIAAKQSSPTSTTGESATATP